MYLKAGSVQFFLQRLGPFGTCSLEGNAEKRCTFTGYLKNGYSKTYTTIKIMPYRIFQQPAKKMKAYILDFIMNLLKYVQCACEKLLIPSPPLPERKLPIIAQSKRKLIVSFLFKNFKTNFLGTWFEWF